MAQQRKPVPKTQSQLSNELSGANNALLGDPNKANPNFAGPIVLYKTALKEIQ